jgi:transposase IS4-like protein/DDE family transposase
LFVQSAMSAAEGSTSGPLTWPAGLGSEEGRAQLREATLAGPASGISPLDPEGRSRLLAHLVPAEAVEAALAPGDHAFRRRRALPGEVTVAVVLGLCLFSGEGYDSVLARTMPLLGGAAGMAPVPSGPALSQARVRLGCEPVRRLFEACAAVEPAPGIGSCAFGLELTAFDGTTAELPADPDLIEEFGCPTGGPRPLARIVTLVSCGNRRVKAAAIGSYHTSEQELTDRLAGSLAPGTLNLADRNFFSMDRWLRFAATGAELAWRVKNGASSLPARLLQRLPDGSYLVRLRESNAMLAKRRKASGDPHAPRLPDTTARLIEFDVMVTDMRGRRRTSRIRLLTTLLDHVAYPARQVAKVYSERWQVEITYLRIKKNLRGPGTVLRGRSPELARQEVWAFLIVYNALCDLAAQAAALEGIDPDEISFVAVLRITRAHLDTDTPCRNCGHRPSNLSDPLDALTSSIAKHPRNRTGRSRTSPRTAAERRTGHTREAVYTITIAESNLLKAD